jgi:hypothetical protein
MTFSQDPFELQLLKNPIAVVFEDVFCEVLTEKV